MREWYRAGANGIAARDGPNGHIPQVLSGSKEGGPPYGATN